MSINLNGKTAIITGASRGIGAATFDALGAAGATVIGTATGKTGETAIAQRLKDRGINGAATIYNAAEAADATTLTQFARNQLGDSPDIVVCNAGITADGLLMRMKDADWQRVINANLNGVFYLSRALIGGMLKKRRGRIIVISSVVAAVGNAGQSNYCAAKAGAEGFVRALAQEVGGRGITVNAIAPGFINTDMTARLPEELRAKLIAQTPLGRMGEAADIAAAAVFLASDGASYITGQTLHVNGGMLMR